MWGICSVVVLSLCSGCVVSRCVVCCLKVWRVSRGSAPGILTKSPFASHVGKGVGPLVMGRSSAGIPRSPQLPRVVPNHISHPLHAGGSERALPGWFCHCLLVSQCVSLCQMLARKPNLYPCRAAVVWAPSPSAQPSAAFNWWCPFRETVRPCACSRHGESHSLPEFAYIVYIPSQISLFVSLDLGETRRDTEIERQKKETCHCHRALALPAPTSKKIPYARRPRRSGSTGRDSSNCPCQKGPLRWLLSHQPCPIHIHSRLQYDISIAGQAGPDGGYLR